MNNFLSKISGLILILAAVLGLVVSVSGIVFLNQNKSLIREQLIIMVDLLDQTMTITSDGFIVINDALGQAEESIGIMQTITEGVADTVGSTGPALDAIGTLVGKDLVAIMTETQTALNAAQASALLIDDTLKFISAVPFIGAKYRPDKPLHTSLKEVSQSMDDMPKSLKAVETNLSSTVDGLSLLEQGISDLASSIGDADKSLTSARAVITQYSGTIDSLQVSIKNLKETLPRTLDAIFFGLFLLFIWLGIAQLGLFTQGLDLLHKRQSRPVVDVEVVEKPPQESELPGQGTDVTG